MRAAAVFVVLFLTTMSFGDVVSFGEGDHTFQIEFVEIGSVGNLPDTRPVSAGPREIGAIDYSYGISKFEMPCSATDAAAILGAFEFTESNCETISELQPASLSLDMLYPFVNWLNTSAGYEAAYNLTSAPELLWMEGDLGYDASNPIRNSRARYFLPSADEFHKAAYYDPVDETWFDYATGSNEEPTPVASGTDAQTLVVSPTMDTAARADVEQAGGASAFGTVGQVGNAPEWEEREEVIGAFWWFSVGVNTQHYSHAHSRQSSIPGGGMGFRIVDLGPFEGDFNRDRQVNAKDIDALSEQIRSMGTDELYDLNADGVVDVSDHSFWVEQLASVEYGDANLDGEVDFGDFLALSGEYETDGGWSGGDFDGSGLTDFDDFLTLSSNFGQAESTAVASVPEPCGFAIAGAITLCSTFWRRRNR